MIPPPDYSNEPPASFLKECPSCRFMHNQMVQQCDQCGIVFSKWKDPAQRAAEEKLAKLAADARGGFPWWTYGIPLSILGVVLLITLVPDVGVPILGAQLRYKLKPGQQLLYDSTLTTNIISPATTASKMTIKLIEELSSVERDSGGNSLLKKNIVSASAEGNPFLSIPIVIPSQETTAWGSTLNVNPMGKTISVGLSNMVNAAKTMQYFQQARAQQMIDLRRQYIPSGSHSFAEEEQDTSRFISTLYSSVNLGQLRIMDWILAFEYPRKRVRVGDSLTREGNLSFHCGFGTGQWNPTLSVKYMGGERKNGAYCTLFQWKVPCQPQIASLLPNKDVDFSQFTIQGVYEARTWINIKDGFIEQLTGHIALTLNGPPEQILLVSQSLGSNQNNSAPIQFDIQQDIKRRRS